MKSPKVSTCMFTMLLLMAVSCSGIGINATLSSAERLMIDKPDSALLIIEKLDTGILVSSRNRARYSLLHTMAIDRTGKDTTDYSLIKDAADYYMIHGNALDKSRAAFYEGRILFNKGEFSSAQACFLRALHHADEIDDEWMKGMVCYYLTDCYNANHLNSEELKYSQLSYQHFAVFGKEDYLDFAVYRLAMANHNNGLYDKADSLYAQIGTDSFEYTYALLGRAENEISKVAPDVQKALKLFEEAYKNSAPLSLYNWYQYAYALVLDGHADKAEALVDRLNNETLDVKSLWWKYAIARRMGNNNEALELYEDYASRQSSYISSLLAQSLYKSERDYYAVLQEQAEQRAMLVSLTFTVLILLLLLILITVLSISRYRKKRMEDEKNALVQKVNDIQGMLDSLAVNNDKEKEQADKKAALQASYVSLFQEQFAEIGKLIGTNWDISIMSSSMQRKHMKYINDVLDEIISDKGTNSRFESRLNRSLDNIVLKLRQDFPAMSEESIRLLCFVFAGFKDPTISTIMNKSISAVSTRKSRLKKQILSADSPNHQLYEVLL